MVTVLKLPSQVTIVGDNKSFGNVNAWLWPNHEPVNQQSITTGFKI